jgi:hypothetical protein
MDDEGFTVGDLRRHLQGLDDDHKLSFGGGLTFYRLKRWADDEHIIEFNEAQGFLSEAFKKRNPHVQVVFIGGENVEWDKSGVIGSQNVEVR